MIFVILHKLDASVKHSLNSQRQQKDRFFQRMDAVGNACVKCQHLPFPYLCCTLLRSKPDLSFKHLYANDAGSRVCFHLRALVQCHKYEIGRAHV